MKKQIFIGVFLALIISVSFALINYGEPTHTLSEPLNITINSTIYVPLSFSEFPAVIPVDNRSIVLPLTENQAVVVPNEDGDLYLTRGAMYSYYEFIVSGGRLADEEWWSMLDDGTEPAMPSWTESFVVSQDETSENIMSDCHLCDTLAISIPINVNYIIFIHAVKYPMQR